MRNTLTPTDSELRRFGRRTPEALANFVSSPFSSNPTMAVSAVRALRWAIDVVGPAPELLEALEAFYRHLPPESRAILESEEV